MFRDMQRRNTKGLVHIGDAAALVLADIERATGRRAGQKPAPIQTGRQETTAAEGLDGRVNVPSTAVQALEFGRGPMDMAVRGREFETTALADAHRAAVPDEHASSNRTRGRHAPGMGK